MKKIKTGLVLAGGGSRGSYQIGVWKALRELNIRPDIITGTSVGALNGALIIQNSYDTAVNLWKSLNTTAIFDFPKEPHFLEYAKAFFHQGGIQRNGLQKLLKNHLQEEKIRASQIPLGMVLVKKQDLSPCQVFTEDIPSGMLPDYLMATTACFPAACCHNIRGVDYIDGGYSDNLPIALAKKKGAHNVIAVCLDEWGTKKTPFANDSSVIPIFPKWDLGNWLLFRKENTERNIRLGYLDAMKTFGVYEGDAFTFQTNTFRVLSQRKQVALARCRYLLKRTQNSVFKKLFPEDASSEAVVKNAAEITARLLKLSPYRIYTADSFLKEVRRKIHCRSKGLPRNFRHIRSHTGVLSKETVGIFLSTFA